MKDIQIQKSIYPISIEQVGIKEIKYPVRIQRKNTDYQHSVADIKLAVNTHSVGAFCYYSKEVLEKVGLIDEDYTNAFEHVDHDYRIAKAGYSTPYWNWPDLANSTDYLDEIECSESSSAIRPRNDWMENIQKGAKLFKEKHGFNPAWQNAVPDTSPEKVLTFLKKIKK